MGCNGAWDAPVEKEVSLLASELFMRVCQKDPVRGPWHVRPNGAVVVWTDASSLGLGVAVEVDGSVVEDASWLMKESDHSHINVAELEAVGQCVNLAIAWGFKTFILAVDSLTVVNWMSNTIDGRHRVRTNGAAEMLVKRRLGVIRDTITEYGLSVTMRLVPTVENKADRMMRVPKKWLGHRGMSRGEAESCHLYRREPRRCCQRCYQISWLRHWNKEIPIYGGFLFLSFQELAITLKV